MSTEPHHEDPLIKALNYVSDTHANMFDTFNVVRDIALRDECERLFFEVRDEEKQVGVEVDEYHKGYKAGLQFVMDLLDVRIGELRDRWG